MSDSHLSFVTSVSGLTTIFHSVLSVLNVKALVDTFKQEVAVVEAFSVIVKLRLIIAKVRLKH